MHLEVICEGYRKLLRDDQIKTITNKRTSFFFLLLNKLASKIGLNLRQIEYSLSFEHEITLARFFFHGDWL